MRKITILLILVLSCSMPSRAQYANIITSDIDHFWEAYDKIVSTPDSAQQYAYLDSLFLQKGTPGLAAMRQLRQYSAKSYIDAIHKYPLYWRAIRSKMFRVNEFSAAIEQNIAQLKQLYPALRPATIYFTVGAFRSGGTTLDSMVLIGSEIAMADEDMPTDEFIPTYSNIKANAKTGPVHRLVFTNVHEYVHTQQKSNNCDNLLAQSVMEGVAEFVAELATGTPSTTPALSYGPQHVDSVRTVFAQQLFNTSTSFWLYSDAENVFGTRDLGYYVGHAICKSYYDRADNKKKAIKEMIELDYNKDTALASFVDQSGYFRKSIAAYHEDYERSRPYVTGITELAGDTSAVSPTLTTITINFSEPLDKRYRNFELGPLGKEHMLKLKAFKGFSEDGRSIVMEVEVAAGKHYQLVIGRGFRTLAGINLKPYLIDFTTGK